jgi:membrane-bound lytic murein transglycosylase B
MSLKNIFYLILFCSFSLSALEKRTTINAIEIDKTNYFIDYMVEKHNFNFDKLYALFSNIQLPIKKETVVKKPKVVAIRTTNRPLRTWDKYSKIFLTEQRIDEGVEFWKKYQKELTRAEKEFNIPAEIIIAILGIETNYGKQKGNHPVLKTLSNFAFNGTHRVDFYKKELEFFLLLMRQNKADPLKANGSYAGAMGYPQFISTSIHHYAVDFNSDNKIDLISNPIDAIGSIANYFNKHFWQKGALIAEPIKKQKALLKIDEYKPIKPTLNAAKRIEYIKIAPKTKVALINLQQEKYADWLTYWNFYVLTRYNHDNRYAMVTFKLSEAIKQQYKK